MITIKWVADYNRPVELKEDGVKAVFLFIPDKTKKITEDVWEKLKRKMADAILSKRLVVIEEGKVAEDKPKRKRSNKPIAFSVNGSVEKENIDECE